MELKEALNGLMEKYVTKSAFITLSLIVGWLISLFFLWKVSVLLSGYPIGKDTSFGSYLYETIKLPMALLYTLGTVTFIYCSFSKNKTISKRYDEFFNAPIVVPVLNVLALLVGIYASVTSAEILGWLTNNNVETITAYVGFDYFLFFLLVILIGYAFHGNASKEAQLKHDSIQKTRLQELEEVIRLAPPGSFGEQLSHYCDILEDWSSNHVMRETNELAFIKDELLTSQDIAKIETAIENQRAYIRACITAFARLAGTFDNAAMNLSSPDVYRANIMLKTTEDVAEYLSKGSEEFKSRYFPKINVTPDHRLFLDKRYSVKLTSSDKAILKDEQASENYHLPETFKHDDEVRNLILPVFDSNPNVDDYGYDENAEFDYATYNLIGAPRALVTGHAQFVYDAEIQIKTWLEEGAPKALYDDAKIYFANDKKGQSIISFPLLCNRYGNGSLETKNISGALNIYRNTKNMFSGDNEKFLNFFHLTSPALVSLSRIIEYHLILLKKAATYHKIQGNRNKEKEDVRTTKATS
jgi:spore coat polysaccharide biosynthesis protein SpsF (cytidylyltransferase family)